MTPHRRAALLGMIGLVAGPTAGAAAPAPDPLARDPSVIDRLKSDYNDILVRRYGGQVFMNFVVGRCEFVETVYEPARPHWLPVVYTRYVTAALAYPRQPRRLLEIGLGGGRIVSYLHRHVRDLSITAIDIDPGVVAMARKHFGLKEDERLKVVVDDGRRFAAETADKYDLIVVDAYRGTFVPETLTTVEFFTLLKSRLNPGGVVAQNVEPTTLFYDAMAATLKEVFGNVDAYRTGEGVANSVLVAYEGAPKTNAEIMARAEALQRRWRFAHPLPAMVRLREPLHGPFGAEPLRDGFNPANTLLAIDKANDANTPRQRRAECGV